MLAREREGREYGTIVYRRRARRILAIQVLEGVDRDDHGHINISSINLASRMAEMLGNATRRTHRADGHARSTASRWATKPAAPRRMPSTSCSDRNWASEPYRALVEQKLNGVMVSVSGQFNLHYVPFEELVDPQTLVTKVRFIEPKSDFHRLARFLEGFVDH
jgi:ATP-dependent phosphofructokinase / diphosphate-dependent phosphofructokinase